MGKIKWELGEVFWFSDDKGIGLVKTESGEDHIVHYSQIKNVKGWKSLKKGQSVNLKLSKDRKEIEEVEV